MTLPDDVLKLIFGLLPAGDLCSVNQVCRKWRRISNDFILWKNLTYSGASARDLKRLLRKRLSKHTRSLRVRIPHLPHKYWTGNTVIFKQVFTPHNFKLLSQLGENLRLLEFGTELRVNCSSRMGFKSVTVVQWDSFPQNQIEELSLFNCYIRPSLDTPCSMESFLNLKSLSLVDCHVTHAVLSLFRELRNLEKLRFNGEEQHISYVVDVIQDLGNRLREIDLSNTMITSGDLRRILMNGSHLVRVTLNSCTYLSRNAFEGLVTKTSCPNLREIEAKNSSLRRSSLPCEWNARGVSLTLRSHFGARMPKQRSTCQVA